MPAAGVGFRQDGRRSPRRKKSTSAERITSARPSGRGAFRPAGSPGRPTSAPRTSMVPAVRSNLAPPDHLKRRPTSAPRSGMKAGAWQAGPHKKGRSAKPRKVRSQIPGKEPAVRGPVDKKGVVQGGHRVRGGKAEPTPPARSAPSPAHEESAVVDEPDEPAAAVSEVERVRAEHKRRVEELKGEHKQKVEGLMRSIHKLQDKTKALRRADKENRRSKLIIGLQNTIGEQEAVIRSMIRTLTDRGFTDAQFAELFKGKKTLRDVDGTAPLLPSLRPPHEPHAAELGGSNRDRAADSRARQRGCREEAEVARDTVLQSDGHA